MIERLSQHGSNTPGNLEIIEPEYEAVEGLTYEVKEDKGQWYVSRSGGGNIPVEAQLGEAMSIALRVQDKVDEALMSEHARRGLLEKVSLMNCRKSAWAVRHPEELKRLITTPQNFEELSKEEREALSGVPELRHELEALFEAGHQPIIGTGEDLHIESYLDEHENELPAVVYVFNAPMRRSDELVMRAFGSGEDGITSEYVMSSLNRDHTFIVLGKDTEGRYACFHKQGPRIDDRFEIVDLESVLMFAVAGSEDKIFMSAIGPVDVADKAGYSDKN